MFPDVDAEIMQRCAIFAGLVMFVTIPVWGQVEDRVPPATSPFAVSDNSPVPEQDDSARMVTPAAVSGRAYPVALGSQERSNYLRGGITFMGAYTDNALGSATGTPESDVSYSVLPFIALDQTTAREHLVLNYAPGYTFYQRFSERNEADQNASINFAYRLSPHVTFSASDGFQKSSSVFNQPDLAATGVVNPGPQAPNFSVIAPFADRLSNAGSVGLTYQFALNDMLGGNGTFTNLHYPNPTEVPGLFDSSSEAGLAFYAHRVSSKNYFGITYQYQRLLAYPTLGTAETQTHAPLVFYSIYPAKGFNLSLFGGPQYSETTQAAQPSLKQWTPAGGASLSWQGHLTSFALSYLHIISSSAGLISAVQLDSATASLSQQITKSLIASVSGGYAQNDTLGTFSTSGVVFNGHSISGTASLQQQIGKSLAFQLAYTRLRQDYGGVPILALTPNTNRESVSVSYQFGKALGR